MLQPFLAAFGDILAPVPLLWVLLGTSLGIVVGAIPGLTGSMLIVLAIPLTLYMDSVHAMYLLMGMYVGAISGGLITATLLRIPGTPSSIVTTFDGYPMAQNGQPGRAVGIGIMSSFVGGLVSWIVLVLFAPLLSRIALKFGSFELFSLVMMALVLIASVGQGSMVKALMAAFLGMMFALPGIDPITGSMRLTFGLRQLVGGISLLPLLIGMFGISQLLKDMINVEETPERIPMARRQLFLTLSDLKKQAVNLLRSSLIGTWIGVLPGIGGNMGSIVAYTSAKNASKTPEKFGTGFEDGIVAAEAANNATISGALIPFLTLGIPGSIITAILMGALILHGVSPGPLLLRESPEVVYGIMSAAFMANLFMFFLMIGATLFIGKLVEMPKTLLIPIILIFCFVGTFALNNRIFDVWVMIGSGLMAFGLERAKVPLAPFLIGFILSPIAEVNLRSGLMLSAGSFLPIVTRPISLLFILVAIATLVWSLVSPAIRNRRGKGTTNA